MDENTLIKDLTETQILSAIREKFTGELVADIDMDNLIDRSTTLRDLFVAIQSHIDRRNDGEELLGKR